jgi:predicted permease
MTIARVLRILRQRWRSIVRRADVDAELEREIAFHIEALTAEKIADGLDPAAARRLALREIGDPARVAEECRDTRQLGWFEDIKQDLTYAARRVATERTLTIVAAASIAIGIGVTASVLQTVDAMLLAPGRASDADRYVFIRSAARAGGDVKGVTAIEFSAWRDRAGIFDAIGASTQGPRTLSATNDLPAESVRGLSITAGYLTTMRMSLSMGREFAAAELSPLNSKPAVIISDRLWRARYAADASILSQSILIDGTPHPVVGVMSADASTRDLPADCWLPLRLLPTATYGAGRALRVSARLKPSVTVDRVGPLLDVLSLEATPPLTDVARWQASVQPLDDARYGWSRGPLLLILGVAGLVLLTACANVAALLIARTATRHREFTLRAALGAGRNRLDRQVLAESIFMIALAVMPATAIAWAGLRALSLLPTPPGAPTLADLALTWSTLGWVGIVSVAAAVFLGLSQTFAVARQPQAEAFRPIMRISLAALQVASTFSLVVVTGLLVQSVARISHRDLHFNPDHLLAFDIAVPGTGRALGQYHDRPVFEVPATTSVGLQRLVDAFTTVPHVQLVAGSSFRAIDAFVVFKPQVATRSGRAATVSCAFVTPRYFETMQTPMLRGREIAATDTRDAPWVVVVNDTAARRLWPGQDPIGQELIRDEVPDDRPRIVVGVVRDVPLRHGDTQPSAVVYESFQQQPSAATTAMLGFRRSLSMVVRYDGDGSAVAAGLRAAAARIDPNIPLTQLATSDAHLAIGRLRLSSLVVATLMLAAIALSLAVIGVYGVVSYGVGARTREIAIRKALGAGSVQVSRVVASQVVMIVAGGIAIGLVLTRPFARVVEPELWGVSSTDVPTYLAAAAVLAIVAALATLAPLRRALSVQPSALLASE